MRKTTQDEIAEWYAGVLDKFGAYIPDADAKRKILTSRNEWTEISAGPKAKRTSGVIAIQWDEMVYELAYAESRRAPGWQAEWEPGFVIEEITEEVPEFTPGPFSPSGLGSAWLKLKARGPHETWSWGPLGDSMRWQDVDANGEPTRAGFERIASALNDLYALTHNEEWPIAAKARKDREATLEAREREDGEELSRECAICGEIKSKEAMHTYAWVWMCKTHTTDETNKLTRALKL
ncbi:hypothetical protein ACFYZ4_15100 [Streptomyces sp. NPDC001513]|uniref:hypothetical protein n=1 Tax=Streptomyces sp. NPDC001513 TaxID=3364580 RepID=UPI0036BE7195